MNRLKIFLLFVLGGTLLLGCERNNEFKVEGYRPVYSADGSGIKSLAPRAINDPGKIYYKDKFIFVNEKGLGVHVIDNADPSNPKNLSFLQIPYNSDISIKGNYLYANNGNDLAVIDVSNPISAHVVRVVQDVIDYERDQQMMYPPDAGSYFECVNPDKGLITGWEKAELTNPECYR